ncbi:MAG: hypothetical protein ABEJ31_14130 [Haloarculaceae archaeon]
MASSHDEGAGPFDACAHCGAPFQPEVRYPATLASGADDEVQLLSFCDATCRRAWEAEAATDGR